jgi:serine/threonine-protein kinase
VKDASIKDPRLLELLEEAVDSGRSPEEVCAGRPELVPELHGLLQQCRVLEGEVAALFPSRPDGPGCGTGRLLGSAGPAIPAVPGYDVTAVLGYGGVGVVYRARHRALNREVALKMLLSGAYAGREELVRFRREAEAVAGLSHPNVVRVYDVGEHDGRPYFTMELADGGTLAQRLDGTPLPAPRAAALVATIAGAVHAAHVGGIVHRDLKPGNILLRGDDSPAVADFGLARATRAEAAVTLSGARLGTPAYMAPEQAAGRAGATGPAADVYALGAILYELLTGRPPFRGETALETARQVVAEEPVPPRRLNAGIPRDLDTICLKCLAKEPRRRYASAAALAEDLGRFGRGEPVAARPVGPVGRAAKWARRRPAVAALWLGGGLVAVGVVAAALSWAGDRAATARAVEEHLRAAGQLRRESRWTEADAAVERAASRLGSGGGTRDLRARLARARADGELVPRLDAIRTLRVTRPGGREARAAYAALFRDAGLGERGADPRTVGERIRAADVRPALVAGVYEWIRCAPPFTHDDWLFAVVREADPDPTGWRDRALDPRTWRDPAAAAALAADPPAGPRTAEQLLAVHDHLRNAGGDSAAYLLRVHRAHPADFWTNLELGRAMRLARNYADAVRYAQAAVVLRPRAAIAHGYLGAALADAGHAADAAASFREASLLDPATLHWRGELGAQLAAAGHHAEALPELEATLPRSATGVLAHARLGDTLEALGRLEDAAAHYAQAVRGYEAMAALPVFSLAPATRDAHARAQRRLRALHVRLGRPADAFERWRAEFEARATEERVSSGYAECRLFAGDEDDYRRACRSLLAQAEASGNARVWERVGRIALLREAPDADLRRATALIDRTLATQRRGDPSHAYVSAAKALAEYRHGRHEAAIALTTSDASDVIGPVPSLVAAMAHARLGRLPDARRALARAVLAYDWSPGGADAADAWAYHVLRREAESLALPDLPGFLNGRHRPGSADERVGLTGACQCRELHATHARLWEEAFAADASLATGGGRTRAASAAALAGCGVGADAAALDEAARAHWRGRAREWVTAEVDAAAKEIESSTGAAAEARGRSVLRSLSTSAELAGLRGQAGLAKVPEAERIAWAALWRRISGLLRRG